MTELTKLDEKFFDDLLKILSEAPRTQVDEDIVADIKKFMNEKHTPRQKYDFIVKIGKEPLNMINERVGVGRITPFIKQACNLEAYYERPAMTSDDQEDPPVEIKPSIDVNMNILPNDSDVYLKDYVK